jgi:hypothetical protein
MIGYQIMLMTRSNIIVENVSNIIYLERRFKNKQKVLIITEWYFKIELHSISDDELMDCYVIDNKNRRGSSAPITWEFSSINKADTGEQFDEDHEIDDDHNDSNETDEKGDDILDAYDSFMRFLWLQYRILLADTSRIRSFFDRWFALASDGGFR